MSLDDSDPDLQRVLPWAGTWTEPDTFVLTFAEVARLRQVDFTVLDTVADGDRVAVFGRSTYRSRTLGKTVTSPFSILAKVGAEKITYFPFTEDTFATWTIQADPDGARLEGQRSAVRRTAPYARQHRCHRLPSPGPNRSVGSGRDVARRSTRSVTPPGLVIMRRALNGCDPQRHRLRRAGLPGAAGAVLTVPATWTLPRRTSGTSVCHPRRDPCRGPVAARVSGPL